MRKTILLATAAAAATALGVNPASAQDHSFAGPRVELLGGYDTIDTDAPEGVDSNLDGGHIRAQAGYDLALGETWRIGAEAGLGWQLGSGNDYTDGTSIANIKSGRDIDLSLRIGAKVGGATLLYAKAGWANTEFRSRLTTGGVTTDEFSDDEDGVRFGAGVEHMLGANLYAKAEYRYTDYGHDLSRHQALLGVGYRF